MADIVITDVTTGAIAGTGSFDKLMAAITVHIEAQYAAGRIQGADYANVYLGSLQSAMAQAVAFTLGEQQAGAQADEILASTVRNDALNAQQVILVTEQHESEAKQNVTGGLLDKQLAILVQQELKLIEDTAFVAQKKETEIAQTEDTITAGAVTGVVGKQKELLAKQTEGFQRDAEQKVLKIMMDSFAVRRSTDSGALPPSKAEDPDIDQFIIKAAAGVSVTLPDTYTIGGTITGTTILAGLTLQNNGVDDLVIPAGATSFTFNTPLPALAAYSVTTLVNTTGQTIVLSFNTGNVAGVDITTVVVTVSP